MLEPLSPRVTAAVAISIKPLICPSVSSVLPVACHSRSCVSNEDGTLNSNSGTATVLIKPYPIRGMYMPDAIASYTVGSQTYLITAVVCGLAAFFVLQIGRAHV